MVVKLALICVLLATVAFGQSFPWLGAAGSDGKSAPSRRSNGENVRLNDSVANVSLSVNDSSSSSAAPTDSSSTSTSTPIRSSSVAAAQANDAPSQNIPGPAQFSPQQNNSSRSESPKSPGVSPAGTTPQPRSAETISALKIKSLDNFALAQTDNVKLVMVVAGSVNKNPEDFYPGSPLKGEPRGLLTAIGKQQGYNYGSFMRQRYGQFLSSEFNETDVSLISASTASAQMSMQSIMGGFYAPDIKAEWNPKVRWNPTPYIMDDSIVNTAHAAKCPAMEDVKSTVEKEIELSLGQKKKIIDYITSQLGSGSDSVNLANIGANFEQMTLRNLSVPSFVANNPFNQNLLPNILGLRFLYQLACARNPDCRHISAGTLLYNIAKDLKSIKDSNLKEKMKFFSTSSDNLAILLWALGVESAGIPSGRSLILEYRDDPRPAVRSLFSEFVDQKPDAMTVSIFHLPGCDAKEEWCPVNTILKLADSETVADWKRVCRVPDSCDTKGGKVSQSNDQKDSVGGFNRVNLAIDCASEEDRSGKFFCEQWAKYDYCKDYVSTRDYYCRYTCLCDERYRVKSL